jgi:hypothetical protein
MVVCFLKFFCAFFIYSLNADQGIPLFKGPDLTQQAVPYKKIDVATPILANPGKT